MALKLGLNSLKGARQHRVIWESGAVQEPMGLIQGRLAFSKTWQVGRCFGEKWGGTGRRVDGELGKAYLFVSSVC